jgi:hypothetical protein
MVECLVTHIHTLTLLTETTGAKKQGTTSVYPNIVASDR